MSYSLNPPLWMHATLLLLQRSGNWIKLEAAWIHPNHKCAAVKAGLRHQLVKSNSRNPNNHHNHKPYDATAQHPRPNSMAYPLV